MANTVMKNVSYIYNAFLWALAIGYMCYGMWSLQMAFNTGYIFYGSFVLLAVVSCVRGRKEEYGIGIVGTAASLAAVVLMGLLFFGPSKSLLTAPAAFVREGIHMNTLPLGTVQAVLAVLIVAGFVAVAIEAVRHPRPVEVETDPDAARLKKTEKITRWATFAVLAVLIIVVSCVPSIHAEMIRIFSLLSSGNVSTVADLIRSYGAAAAVVSFLLMILQSLAAPIPAFLITFANAGVFGWWQGAILSWTSAMAGAAICFWIARALGRDAVAHFVSNTALESVDRFFDRYGKNAILICRLLPFMSFDYVSYAAGLTGMGFADFMVATGIGQLPATIVYSYVGGMLTGSTKTVVMGLLIAFALFALIVLVRQVFKNRHADLMEDDGTEGPHVETAAQGQ